MTSSATQINAVLVSYAIDPHLAQIEPLGGAGGMSGAQFWRITVVRESPDPTRRVLCLRRWPIEHPSPPRLKFIHAFLQHARSRGISFVPVPISTKDGESFVNDTGHLWQLEPWMPGAADFEVAPRVEKLRAAMTSLARLHVATRDFGQNAAPIRVGGKAEPLRTANQSAVARRLTQLRELSKPGIGDLSRAINKAVWPEFAALALEFIARLPKAVRSAIAMLEPLATAELTLQPCVRDIWHDRVLFTGDEVTGIIDFGAVDFDTPATDIARLLGSLVADDAQGWQTGLEAYVAVRSLSLQQSLAVLALDMSGTILAGCNWIRWIYIERRRFENQPQVLGRFRSILERLKRIQ